MRLKADGAADETADGRLEKDDVGGILEKTLLAALLKERRPGIRDARDAPEKVGEPRPFLIVFVSWRPDT